MNYTFATTSPLAHADSPSEAGRGPDKLAELGQWGVRAFRAHNIRQQAASRGGKGFTGAAGGSENEEANDARATSAARGAIATWQQANMIASGAETLLSRVLGGYRAAFGPSTTPDLIAEVMEMRARANELLYDVLTVTR